MLPVELSQGTMRDANSKIRNLQWTDTYIFLTDHASIVLMITNECVFDMIKAHKLVTKLRDQYGLDITTNWENQELIGKDGFQWYQDTINRSTIVIFIFETWSNTNSMKDSGMPAEIRQSMQCVGYSQVAANTDAVILTMKHVECKKISPSGIRIFEGNRNFHKLLRILTGKNVSASLTLDKLLATEQRYSPFETSQPMTVALDCEGQESGFTNSLIRYSTWEWRFAFNCKVSIPQLKNFLFAIFCLKFEVHCSKPLFLQFSDTITLENTFFRNFANTCKQYDSL